MTRIPRRAVAVELMSAEGAPTPAERKQEGDSTALGVGVGWSLRGEAY